MDEEDLNIPLELGGVSVCDCESDEDAALCRYVLDLAGIRSVIPGRTRGLDLRWPRVMVAPDDLDAAKEILSKPVDPEVRQAFEEEPVVGDFESPPCVRCSSCEVMLEGVADELWRCEARGEVWSEAAEGC